MKISVGISNHHVHLSTEDFKILFQDIEMNIRNPLNQPGEFASNLKVSLVGPKGIIENVTVVGPIRSYTQVEISKTDAYRLGISPPVKNSGDLEGASSVKIIGPCGEILKSCAIIATRHIHVDPKIRAEKNLIGLDEVSIRIPGEKSGILDHVYLKDVANAFFEVHLDTDDANAFLLKNEDEVEIIF